MLSHTHVSKKKNKLLSLPEVRAGDIKWPRHFKLHRSLGKKMSIPESKGEKNKVTEV